MKLRENSRVQLGERVFLRDKSLLMEADGSVLIVVERQTEGAWQTCVERITDSGIQASAQIPEGAFGATPVLARLADGSIAALSDQRTVTVYNHELEPQRTFKIAGEWSEPWEGTTAGGVARPQQDGTFLIRLTDPASFQNSRAVATLKLTATEGVWMSWHLAPRKNFPMSGPRAKSASGPILGDVLVHDAGRFLIAEGSDAGSVNKYGSDFFTLARVDSDYSVLDRIYEAKDWKDQPGKHGITARFTSDNTAAILRPVFRTGEWKGKARLVDLANGTLTEVPAIRGAAGFSLADIRGDRAVLLSEDSLLFATVER